MIATTEKEIIRNSKEFLLRSTNALFQRLSN